MILGAAGSRHDSGIISIGIGTYRYPRMVELSYLFGVLLALGASFSNSINNLSIRHGTAEGRASDAIFIIIGINLLILLPLVTVIYYPDYGLTKLSWISFVLAGIVGTLFGRVFKFTSIAQIGASRTEPLVASHALIASVLGVVFLGERLTLTHSSGIVLIVLGVAILSLETTRENPDNLSRRELFLGMLLPFGAAVAYGVEPIFATVALNEGTPAPVGVIIKTFAAMLGFSAYLWWNDSLPDFQNHSSTALRWFVIAGVANTIFVLGYYVALTLAPVSVVYPLIATQTLFVVILSALFMPQNLERVTWQLAAAALLVVAGVLVITLFS